MREREEAGVKRREHMIGRYFGDFSSNHYLFIYLQLFSFIIMENEFLVPHLYLFSK